MRSIYDIITEQAQAMIPQLRRRRRDFHTYAESGWFEIRTSSLIAQRLTELGYEVLTGRDVCLDEGRMGLPPAEETAELFPLSLHVDTVIDGERFYVVSGAL